MAHDLYVALVVLHVLCAVVGFGSLAISGVYGFGSRRPAGPEAVAEAGRYFASPGRLELLVVPVPFLGAAALAVQPGGRGVFQLWSGLAGAVWLVAAVVLFGVVRPSERRMRGGLAADDRAATAAAGSRLGWASVATDVAFAVGFFLMIFQPR